MSCSALIHKNDKIKHYYQCIYSVRRTKPRPPTETLIVQHHLLHSSHLSHTERSAQTTTAAAPANTAPTPQAQPVTSAATRGASPVLLAVTNAVTVTSWVLIYPVMFVPFDAFVTAAEAAELKAGSREVGEEGSSVGAGVVFASVLVAASVDLHVAAVGRSLTL
jgi:hypothetical protein